MALQLERVTHRFGNQKVLADVSLSIETGDCFGFIGHNGAGKTTAMRVMLGLLNPDEGRVIVDGFAADAYPREARVRMGALIEQAGFHPHWSGAKNLYLLARLAGKPADIAELLDRVGLGHAGDKPVRAYSQGMRQRLGVAQALLGDPAYVLLDEPSNGLDPDGIQEMRELLRHLTRDEGRTVLVSSHQLHELSGICNRVGVLRQGRLVMEETIENLLRGDRYVLETSEPERAIEVFGRLGLPARAASALTVELGDRPPGAVLKDLVEAGIDVDSFAPRPPSLEDIYNREAEPLPPPAPVEVGEPEERRAPPRPVRRMVGHEFRRWLGQWTVPASLAIPALVGVLAMLIRREESMKDAADVMAGDLASATAVNAFEGVARAMHPGLWLLSYIVMALASQSIAGEFSQGTLRNVVLRPITRVQVALGKWLALLLTTLGAYALLVLVAVVGATWAFEWKGVVEILPNGEPWEHVKVSELKPIFWRALAAPILPLLAFAGLGLLAGTVVRRGATALATAIGLGLLFDIGREFLVNTSLEAWSPATYLPSKLTGNTSFTDHYLRVSQGMNDSLFLFPGTEVYAPLLWATGTFVAAAWILKRRYVP
ncbi:MAG: ATP-binding cassette domain-containing protein [Planctomycetota bacterium]|jgi:ABC-2 type transport system ATP-binding protein